LNYWHLNQDRDGRKLKKTPDAWRRCPYWRRHEVDCVARQADKLRQEVSRKHGFDISSHLCLPISSSDFTTFRELGLAISSTCWGFIGSTNAAQLFSFYCRVCSRRNDQRRVVPLVRIFCAWGWKNRDQDFAILWLCGNEKMFIEACWPDEFVTTQGIAWGIGLCSSEISQQQWTRMSRGWVTRWSDFKFVLEALKFQAQRTRTCSKPGKSFHRLLLSQRFPVPNYLSRRHHHSGMEQLVSLSVVKQDGREKQASSWKFRHISAIPNINWITNFTVTRGQILRQLHAE